MLYNEDRLMDKQSTNKTAVIFAINGTYAFCLYVSICSLIKNSPKLYEQSDIIIYANDISKRDKFALKTLQNLKIIDYSFPLKIQETKAVKTFSIASFARYECFNMLNSYEKIIYLDSDILVQQELLSIFDLIKDTGIGLIKEKTNVESFSKAIGKYDVTKKMFNSGFFVLNNKLKANFKEVTDFCYQNTVKYIEDLYLPDQAIINYAIQYFKFNPTNLQNIYNTPASLSRKILHRATVIHSTGNRKFWNYYYFDEWYKYYKKWIKNNGTPIDAVRRDSKIYKKFLEKTKLNKFVFFQLCPDIIKKPIKAIRFFIKFIFKIKY